MRLGRREEGSALSQNLKDNPQHPVEFMILHCPLIYPSLHHNKTPECHDFGLNVPSTRLLVRFHYVPDGAASASPAPAKR